MYQYTSHADPFLHPAYCAASAQSQFSPPSPSHHRSPSSDSGGFLGSPSLYSSLIPSSCLHDGTSSALSLHVHLVDRGPHCSGGSSRSSPHLYEEPDVFELPSDCPMSRAFSTGDVQGKNSLPSQGPENCHREVAPMAPGGRVGRYSAEERKERIERYRSKRNQRNFQKKITYACRKTLADGRPRVRGRFARNGETEADAEAAGEVGSCNNSSSQSRDECYARRPAMDEEDEYTSDPDFCWASFFDNYLSMNSLIS